MADNSGYHQRHPELLQTCLPRVPEREHQTSHPSREWVLQTRTRARELRQILQIQGRELLQIHPELGRGSSQKDPRLLVLAHSQTSHPSRERVLQTRAQVLLQILQIHPGLALLQIHPGLGQGSSQTDLRLLVLVHSQTILQMLELELQKGSPREHQRPGRVLQSHQGQERLQMPERGQPQSHPMPGRLRIRCCQILPQQVPVLRTYLL